MADPVISAVEPLGAHILPSLDWLVELAAGLIIAAAGMLLFRQAKSGGLAFALALFVAETGTLVAIRALIAAGASSRWQYIMPFALVLVPALYVSFILTRLGWWRKAGFNSRRDWKSPQLMIPLLATLALPALGLAGHGVIEMLPLIFVLQVAFMIIDVFMEEATYRGIIMHALQRYPPTTQVLVTAALFGLSHMDNVFLPGADEIGVLYQIFEATLVGILLTGVRLRMNTIWPVMAVHAAYDFMLILAFGHAYPVAPTMPGFVLDTTVNLAFAALGLLVLRRLPRSIRAVREAA
jgi:membrane protease YdiL (CAAX protease family)